ncbi:MAG: helix-turn-helix domain-containing protein [Euryarchaeota archaeon]|nr:helix-turn-helix domain-containing protein [Euryarchaeota archaeon]MCG2738155.1 helix-turn-helix domain-containing protein [Candidatus Methanoperedenaceae archaeon]
MTTTDRIDKIMCIMEDIERSSLSVSQYFKEKTVPFGRAQYYLYRKTIEERGLEGLTDLRSKGNHLKFTDEIKNFVKGLLNHNQSIISEDIQRVIQNEFGTSISIIMINNFRRENNLCLILPQKEQPLKESGASEIAIALALETGIIDVIT